MDNVVATPHVGGVSEEAMARLADRVAAILKEFLLSGASGPRA
jgi:phosphoglycerate dehydrogenase-like enzyme